MSLTLVVSQADKRKEWGEFQERCSKALEEYDPSNLIGNPYAQHIYQELKFAIDMLEFFVEGSINYSDIELDGLEEQITEWSYELHKEVFNRT